MLGGLTRLFLVMRTEDCIVFHSSAMILASLSRVPQSYRGTPNESINDGTYISGIRVSIVAKPVTTMPVPNRFMVIFLSPDIKRTGMVFLER